MGYLRELQGAMQRMACTGETALTYDEFLEQVLSAMRRARAERRSAYFIGNGGSAAIAVHMTSDFLRNGRLRTHSMHDPAVMTCLANDFGYEQVFSKQLDLVADAGDILVAISSSGKSQNILNAVQSARERKCRITTLSGFAEGNPLRQMGDWNLYVPSMEYGIVESIHNMVLQQIVDMLKRD